ncbi:MAG: response regulator [Myxococcales bacterium]|nr:response regulator [Myxococcales bacterium]
MLIARFVRVFAPIVVVVACSGVAVAWALLSAAAERAASQAALTVRDASAALTTTLTTAFVHTLAVSTEPPVRAAIDAPSDDTLDGMAAAFTSLLTRNPHYAQARWIDEVGRERVRLERSSGGSVRRVIALQEKVARPYVRSGLASRPGEVTLSRLDLNVENGAIEEPRRPMVRLVARVADRQGTPSGLIVINVGMGTLLSELRARGVADGAELAMLDSHGEWLLGPNPEDEFAFMYGREVTFGQRDPKLWRRIEAASEGRRIDGGIWAWARVDPVDDPRFAVDRSNRTPWILLAQVDAGAMTGHYFAVIGATGLLAVIMLGMFGALSWRLAREQAELSAARDEAEIRARAEWLSHEIAAAANAASDAEEMVYRCLRPLCEATHIGVAVAMFGDRLGMHFIADANDPAVIGEVLAGLDGAEWPRALGASTAPQWLDLNPEAAGEAEDSWRRRAFAAGIRGLLGIPLIVDGKAVASCVLLYTPASGAKRRELEGIVDAALESLAAQVGRVISRERATKAMAEARAAAEEASQAKSDFVATMSHELRTPLNGILGVTELLRRRPLGAKERAYVEMIARSGDLLLALISDVLDLSKIEAKKLDIEAVPLSLERLISDVAATMRVQAEQRGLALSAEIRGTIPTLAGDPKRVRQVLVNLLGNALKFTERGSVLVEAEVVARARELATVRVTVRDTGVGIPAEKLDAVFRSYEQTDASTARRYGGTGLGLAITKHLVELMGGEIGVRSTPGVGSEFWFTLPLKIVEAPAEESARADRRAVAPLPGAGRARLLVAEDNPVNQVVVTAFLEELGFTEVDLAEDGKVAKERLLARAYDLVLMDVQMPELSGIELIRWLRAGGDGSPNVGVPVIALTANAMATDVERYCAAGMNDHLSKPLSIERLAAVLRVWLRPEAAATGS